MSPNKPTEKGNGALWRVPPAGGAVKGTAMMKKDKAAMKQKKNNQNTAMVLPCLPQALRAPHFSPENEDKDFLAGLEFLVGCMKSCNYSELCTLEKLRGRECNCRRPATWLSRFCEGSSGHKGTFLFQESTRISRLW